MYCTCVRIVSIKVLLCNRLFMKYKLHLKKSISYNSNWIAFIPNTLKK